MLQGSPGADRSGRAKVRSVADLARLSEAYRHAGQKVVLAHGTFDLLHLGHIRYLEEGRRQGHVLFVTVTADRFASKGPGRPVFSEMLRAETLGALSCVDGVAINDAPTAVNVIKTLKPDVYVKGIEYKDVPNDVTGKIIEEVQAVEAYGGHVHYSDDLTFSSSALINRYIDVGDPEVRSYADTARDRGFGARLPILIDSVANMRVLLVGETIIDEYHYVSPLGKPSKENVLATLSKSREVFSGGVIAAANHVAGFCRQVDVVTLLGDSDSDEDQVRRAVRPNVGLWTALRTGAPTTRKTRFVEADFFRKLFELYEMDDSPLPPSLEDQIADEIVQRAKEADVVIVTDFGHGLLTPALREALVANSRFLAVNAQTNSGNQGFNLVIKYPRADYVCVDAPEARLAVADKDADLGVIASTLLPQRMSVDRVILTHGRNGCVTFAAGQGTRRVPAFTRRTLDTMGAGDAFLAVTSPLAAVTDDMEMVGFIGNVVGSIKVGILGHRQAVEKSTTLKYIQALLK